MSKFNVGDRVCWGKTAVGTIIPNRFPDMLEGFVSVQWDKSEEGYLMPASEEPEDALELIGKDIDLIAKMRNALIAARDCIAFEGSLDRENDTIIANRALTAIDDALDGTGAPYNPIVEAARDLLLDAMPLDVEHEIRALATAVEKALVELNKLSPDIG